ncbi:hypothetical protein [Aquitalea magnusonii]|nr:hypothetical protein [Aquitalea magnusonii]
MPNNNYLRYTAFHYVQLLLANMPLIYVHFLAFFVVWSVCRYLFLDGLLFFRHRVGVKWFYFYIFVLLALMVLVSLFISISFYQDRILFMRNDFIFLAGVLLVPVRAVFILILALLCSAVKLGELQLDVPFFQRFIDMLIYGLVGVLVRKSLNVDLQNMVWSDFWFIAVNKLLASVCSAGVFAIFFSDTWNLFFDVLVLRVLGWPVVSLPLLVGFIYCVQMDWREYRQQIPV